MKRTNEISNYERYFFRSSIVLMRVYRISYMKEEAICVGDFLISQTNIEENVDRMYVCSETNHECSSWISE